jgi:two-component system sensor histidine kinase PhoQ
VRWAIGSSPSLLTFSVAAPLAAQGAEIDAYRRSLWGALAVMAVLLLLALVVVQRWGLRPLRRLARQLARMEAGEIREVPGAHPAELAPLVANLNRLLVRERTQLERYRAALGDLAHSLKTPLAVLRGAPADAHLPTVVAEQISRMDQIVNYQLQRAATAGASQSGAPLPVATLVERLFATMAKVYAARALQLDHDIDAGLAVRLDEGDAMELLGNLVDNACKWATHRVRVHAERRGGGLWLVVDDDGPGIDEPERLLRRGQRGDERMPGHGIGLAIAQDIALAYRGELRIERNEAGGARVVAWLGQA